MSYRIQIPDVGDKIQLAKDWKFKLFHEYRNDDLWKIQTGEEYNWKAYGEIKFVDFVIPAQTVLTIDRVYIRKGLKNFSSVSFIIGAGCPNKEIEKKRFWAKLEDVNTIEANNMKVCKVYTLDFWPVNFPINCRARDRGLMKLPDYDVHNPKTFPEEDDTKFDAIHFIEKQICAQEPDGSKPVFNVGIDFLFEDKLTDKHPTHGYWFPRKVWIKCIIHTHYTLKDLNGKTLFETDSFETLKRKGREIYKAQCENS